MKRICSMHGLWNKTEQQPKCPKCKTINNKLYDRNIRDKDADKFYHSAEWKKIREVVLTNNPFCISCGRAADTVDHIVAIKNGGSKLSLDNLQSMCNSCHNVKENKEGNRWNK